MLFFEIHEKNGIIFEKKFKTVLRNNNFSEDEYFQN